MAHTDKTMPFRIQREDGREWLRDLGGQWEGMGWLRRWFNRRDRADARRTIRRGDDPAPVQPRSRAKWDWL